MITRRPPAIARAARRNSASRTPANSASGGVPLFGRPGMVLPVTVVEAESLAGFGSAGVVAVRVAVLVTGVVRVAVAVIRSVADAPKASGPTSQTPVPGVYTPWLGDAVTNVKPAGRRSVT